MSKNPVADYNAQNGVSETGGPDPAVIAMISQAAAQTGADPVALLATALQESGAQRGRVGDAGTSFGPFQEHRGGALANHSPAWANSLAAVQMTAREFARLGVHGGPGAAAVQRPADRQLYARGVNSLLGKADAILDARYGGADAPGGKSFGPTPALPSAPPGGVGAGGPLSSLAPTARLAAVNAILGGNTSALASLVQQAGGKGASPSAAHSAVSSPGGGAQPLAGSAGKGIYQRGNWAGADQGVDFRGAGPVTALADAVVTRVQAKSSWIGAGGKGTGAVISYRITSGPYAGRNVYVAENITPHVQVGQHVRAGQPIATAHGSFPYTESGWADAHGSPLGVLGTSSTGADFAKAWSLR